MVTGRLVEEEDLALIVLEGREVEAVEEFPYLGSLVESSGRMDADVNRRGTGINSFWCAQESCLP